MRLTNNERALRNFFMIKLDEYIGEQKIDAVMAKDENRLIEKIALRDGVEL